MDITKERTHYKPFDYPWAFEYYKQQNQVHWMVGEVPLADDVYDWKFKLTAAQKNLITQILRFFTQGDVDIARSYIEKYMQYFPSPEMRMMLSAIANTEAIHAHAYSQILDTLNLPESEYKAFQEYEEMSNKHDYMFNDDLSKNSACERSEIALNLAKFSAFGEGMQLFSSFAILLNFQRFNLMKGLGQIITWSVRDESLHCEAMTKAFNTFVDENPHIWTDELKRGIYQSCRDMVNLEDKFIDLAYEMGDVEGLDKEDVKLYIRFIADRRLLLLRLKPNYGVKTNPLEWFDNALLGVEHANFFEARSTEYSKSVERGNWEDAF